MNRIRVAIASLVIGLTPALFVSAQDNTSPATQPAASSGSLPAGHPDISQMTPPPSSPGAAGSAMPAGVSLPAGHPDISQMMADAKAPSTQPGAISGTVTVRAVQSTPGGPAVSNDEVTVEFYVNGQLLDRAESKLDDKGVATFNGVPLMFKPQPIAKVKHAGIEYQAVGDAMDSKTMELSVPVYETTEEAPAWQVRMRHVMIGHVEGGLQITEMLAIDNPGDRAWLGTPTSDHRHATFSVTLPENAVHPKLIDGQRECDTRVEGTTLTNLSAVAPGNTQYQLSYMIPATDGKASLSVSAPALVKTLMVMVPDDGMAVKAQGVELAGSSDMGTGKTRFYRASDVAAGQVITLALSNIVDPVKASAAGSTSGSSTNAAQIIGGVGAAIILLFGIAFLFMKPAPKPQPKTAAAGKKRA
jgi:hypothetical protein